jgi:hypothetical protein
LTGLATFFFGFGAGALLNWYFIATNNPFVQQFRSTLTYSSAIIGDGLLRRKRYLAKRIRVFGVLGGLIITAYFHITQALEGIVNWAMPSPWHWNALGVWHFFYMLSVTTLISTFYITSFVVMRAEKRIPRVVFLVSVGIFIFLVLLRVDYINVKIF